MRLARLSVRSITERSCIALPHPTLGTSLPPSALKALDKTPLSALNAEFVSGVQLLKTRLFGRGTTQVSRRGWRWIPG